MSAELKTIVEEIIKLRLDVDALTEELQRMRETTTTKRHKSRLFDSEGNFKGF